MSVDWSLIGWHPATAYAKYCKAVLILSTIFLVGGNRRARLKPTPSVVTLSHVRMGGPLTHANGGLNVKGERRAVKLQSHANEPPCCCQRIHVFPLIPKIVNRGIAMQMIKLLTIDKDV